MSQEKYQQICLDVEDMHVILEFPPGNKKSCVDQKESGQEEDVRRIKKEIREIFISELQEKVKEADVL